MPAQMQEAQVPGDERTVEVEKPDRPIRLQRRVVLELQICLFRFEGEVPVFAGLIAAWPLPVAVCIPFLLV